MTDNEFLRFLKEHPEIEERLEETRRNTYAKAKKR